MLREKPPEVDLSRQFLNVGKTKGFQNPRVHPRSKFNAALTLYEITPEGSSPGPWFFQQMK
jgi:hypothetical protein